METKKIRDKNNNIYTLEINEKIFTKNPRDNHDYWIVNYNVKNSDEKRVGSGIFYIKNKKTLNYLINIGADKITEKINKEESIDNGKFYL